ncbi:post-GPI attachment to proteins factor 4 [Alosa pseudoharengus]|uniref:post-GPI attachment to proteins factor 4 n=1 Tax=Alosa pseudoharengus TaxID=34774 RepID=UPI003F8C3237
MLRWRVIIARHVRWSSPVIQGLFLCILTFGVVLPLCCHRLMYSYYFLKFMYLDSMSEEALKDSYNKGQEALHFWQEMTSSTKASALTPTSAPEFPEFLVTVVTAKRREGQDYHYLLQVMQRLLSLLGDCGERPCAEVLVCDVETGPLLNEDATLLEKQFLVVRRSAEQSKRRGRLNTFEKEKQDYVYCLRKGWELRRPKNVLILEDDSLPRPDFFSVIQDLLSRSFTRNTLYVKLYHPERLQRYWNPEPYRIFEWVGLGLVGASAFFFMFSYCSRILLSFSVSHFLFFTVYVMVAVELVGRHYLLEMRRLSPQLYAVSPATECCTPAMLYPGNASARVADYLDQVTCSKGNAKDTVLYKIARSTQGERAHSVEPNLISHIGAYSSVRSNPLRPKLLP